MILHDFPFILNIFEYKIECALVSSYKDFSTDCIFTTSQIFV
jgi:hypothetical protein